MAPAFATMSAARQARASSTTACNRSAPVAPRRAASSLSMIEPPLTTTGTRRRAFASSRAAASCLAVTAPMHTISTMRQREEDDEVTRRTEPGTDAWDAGSSASPRPSAPFSEKQMQQRTRFDRVGQALEHVPLVQQAFGEGAIDGAQHQPDRRVRRLAIREGFRRQPAVPLGAAAHCPGRCRDPARRCHAADRARPSASGIAAVPSRAAHRAGAGGRGVDPSLDPVAGRR